MPCNHHFDTEAEALLSWASLGMTITACFQSASNSYTKIVLVTGPQLSAKDGWPGDIGKGSPFSTPLPHPEVHTTDEGITGCSEVGWNDPPRVTLINKEVGWVCLSALPWGEQKGGGGADSTDLSMWILNSCSNSVQGELITQCRASFPELFIERHSRERKLLETFVWRLNEIKCN